MNDKIEVNTPLGVLCAEKTGDPDYPGIAIYVRREDGSEIDITMVECSLDRNYLFAYLWGDTTREDYTNSHGFSAEEINANID